MPEKIMRHATDSIFIETSKLLNSTLDIDELLDIILDLTAKAMEAQASSLLLIDKKKGKLELHVSRKAKHRKKLNLRIGEGIAGWVAEHREAAISNQVKKDPRYSPKLQEQIGFSIDSLICVPLLRRDNMIGVVAALNKSDESSTRLIWICCSPYPTRSPSPWITPIFIGGQRRRHWKRRLFLRWKNP